MRATGYRIPSQYRTVRKSLTFKPMSPADIPVIAPFMPRAATRTCDFTVGGMVLWADWFRYRMCICDNTLFVRGISEDDMHSTAFSLPVGDMPLADSVALLLDYCKRRGIPLLFSAVPQEYVEPLLSLGASSVIELPDWADYLYSIDSLATFAGKKLNKKRNHINRFIADNPGYTLEPVTPDNIGELSRFFESMTMPDNKPLMAEYDRCMVREVLARPQLYPFEGAALRLSGADIVAFAFGEVAGDTLVVHIEKIDHSVAGAGEVLCRDFAALMKSRHPQLLYENREDDAGDPGLRQAKQALCPCALLRKYNVRFD